VSDILVTAKVNPDLDGTSCILSYSDLLNRTGYSAEGLVFGFPQSEVSYFIDNHHIHIPTTSPDTKGDWEKFVLVDMSAMIGSPPIVSREKVIEIIDHREGIEEFPNAKIQNDFIGAAATIVVERFRSKNLLPLSDHAKLLYGAIFHNTLNFLSSNTTARDRQAATYLEKEFRLSGNIISEMFDYATKSIDNDIYSVIHSDAKEFEVYNHKIGFYQLVTWTFKDRLKPLVEASLIKIDREMGCSWSLINIIELGREQNHIFSSSQTGQQILSKVLGVTFLDNWASLKPVLLRKQIMPKIKAASSSVLK
jgi:inorganic pyrophosphatase/exopolyphosphatase